MPTQPESLGVVVIGASSGIGKETMLAFAGGGARVVAVSRTAPDNMTTRISHARADVANTDDCARAFAEAAAGLGSIDVVVIAAGVMIIDQVKSAKPEDWREMLEVNLLGAMNCARIAIPYLSAAAGGGRGCADLVFVGSLSGRFPAEGRAAYAATKAGLHSFANVLRKEVAPEGIRVSLVEPGLTDTNLRARSRPDAIESMVGKSSSLGGVEPLPPSEVADCITWLVLRPKGVAVPELTVIPASQAAAAMS